MTSNVLLPADLPPTAHAGRAKNVPAAPDAATTSIGFYAASFLRKQERQCAANDSPICLSSAFVRTRTMSIEAIEVEILAAERPAQDRWTLQSRPIRLL
jgi:hypothetical protein